MGNRSQQRTADAFRFGFDLERRLCGGLLPDIAHELRDDERDREHDRERQHVLHVIYGERAARRNEKIIERRHANRRCNDGGPAREFERDDDNGKQIDKCDVDQVEPLMHRQAHERACDHRADRPNIANEPVPSEVHAPTIAQPTRKFPDSTRALPLCSTPATQFIIL